MNSLLKFINVILTVTLLTFALLISSLYFPKFLAFNIEKIAPYFSYQIHMDIDHSLLQDPRYHSFFISSFEIGNLGEEVFFSLNNLELEVDLLRSALTLFPKINSFKGNGGFFNVDFHDLISGDYEASPLIAPIDIIDIKDLKVISIQDKEDSFIIKRAIISDKSKFKDFNIALNFSDGALAFLDGEIINSKNIDLNIETRGFNFTENFITRNICSLCFFLGYIDGKGSLSIKNSIVKEIKSSFRSNVLKGSIDSKDINKGLYVKLDFLNVPIEGLKERKYLDTLSRNQAFPIEFQINELFINDQYRGSWNFNFIYDNSIQLENIEGSFGVWNISSLNQSSRFILGSNQGKWLNSFSGEITTNNISKGLEDMNLPSNISSDSVNLLVDLSWEGFLTKFSLSEVQGSVKVNATRVLFSEIEDKLRTESNYLRFISIFNLTDTFEKITNLDFTKLLSSGYGVDNVTGKFLLHLRSLEISEPIIFKSGSSEIQWTGSLLKDLKGDLDDIELEVLTTLPFDQYIPAYALVLGGPITAGAFYIAGKLFEKEIDKLGTGKWVIRGNLDEPEIEFLGWNY